MLASPVLWTSFARLMFVDWLIALVLDLGILFSKSM
jgi:hypothetical protein